VLEAVLALVLRNHASVSVRAVVHRDAVLIEPSLIALIVVVAVSG
jgi:hypothetical protein